VRRQLMLDGALGFDSRYNGSIWQCCRSLDDFYGFFNSFFAKTGKIGEFTMKGLGLSYTFHGISIYFNGMEAFLK